MPIVASFAVLAVITGVLVLLFATRDQADPKPVSEALEEFAATSTSFVAGTVARRPPAGVYVLEGEGREEISFPPTSQDDGATMPASVTHLADGCWSFKIDYNEAHWQDWSLCPSGDSLVETGGRTWQAWDFGASTVTNLSTFACDPPALFVPGSTAADRPTERSCTGTNEQVPGTTTSAGTVTSLGSEALDIEGRTVAAIHVRFDNTLTGAQTGDERNDLWLRVDDWLPLRGEREVHIDSDSPVGTITYTEQGSWQLTSTDRAGP